jgi:hypothetical protein
MPSSSSLLSAANVIEWVVAQVVRSTIIIISIIAVTANNHHAGTVVIGAGEIGVTKLIEEATSTTSTSK